MFERFDVLLSGGEVWSSSGSARVDVGITGGKIAAVGEFPLAEATEIIDVTGLWVLPGVIDTQVHFREPGLEHKEDLESGTRAAIAGGVTAVFEMPNTNPPTTTARALDDKLQRAQGRAWCDYSFFVGGSPENVDELEHLESLPGTPGVKVFMGSSTGSLLVDDEQILRRIMQHGRHRMAVHSEDEAILRATKAAFGPEPQVQDHPKIRSVEAAVASTTRLINLCRETRRPVHILHISTADELPLIAAAKREGLPVTCEVTPHHLTLDSRDYATLGSKVQMNPPVRDKAHQDALWQAVLDGLVDVLGSDHAPHTAEEKSQPYPQSPSGMPGVQTLLPVMVDWAVRGRIGVERIVRLTSEAPAEIYGIEGKGKIESGFDADIAVVDPGGETSVTADWLQSKCGWSPYEGRTWQGRVVRTILRGAAVYDGNPVGTPAGEPVQFGWKSGQLSSR